MINYDPRRLVAGAHQFSEEPDLRHAAARRDPHRGSTPRAVVWIENRLDFEEPLGPQILSLLGIILGLLLVFRTNTAYDRWWEGRQVLGPAHQREPGTRAAARRHASAATEGRREEYAELLAAWPEALIQRLRGNGLREPGRLSARSSGAASDIREGALPGEALISLTPLMAPSMTSREAANASSRRRFPSRTAATSSSSSCSLRCSRPSPWPMSSVTAR